MASLWRGVRALWLTLSVVLSPVAVVPLFVAPAAVAQDRTVETIEAERRAALAEQVRIKAERDALERQLEDLKTEMSRVGRQASALESREAEMRARVEALEGEASGLQRAINADRGDMGRLLGVLQRIEANPPPTIVGSGAGGTAAVDSARAARLTASVATTLQARADKLVEDLSELEDVRARLADERAELASERERLGARRAELRKLSKAKADLSAKLGRDEQVAAKRAQALADEAETLRELVAGLEAASKVEPRVKPGGSVVPRTPGEVFPRIKPPVSGRAMAARPLPDGLRFADARGQLGLPVRGVVATRFGGTSQGVSVRADAAAQVASPYGGRVEFAGPFKNYESLVILNAGDGYFVVLAGMGETFVGTGETVAAGEPIGVMPRGTDGELYMEFRKDGRTIDPGPWLAAG